MGTPPLKLQALTPHIKYQQHPTFNTVRTSYHPLTMSSPKKTGIQVSPLLVLERSVLSICVQMELNVSDQLAKIIGTKKGEKISRPQVSSPCVFSFCLTSFFGSVSRGSGPISRR